MYTIRKNENKYKLGFDKSARTKITFFCFFKKMIFQKIFR